MTLKPRPSSITTAASCFVILCVSDFDFLIFKWENWFPKQEDSVAFGCPQTLTMELFLAAFLPDCLSTHRPICKWHGNLIVKSSNYNESFVFIMCVCIGTVAKVTTADVSVSVGALIDPSVPSVNDHYILKNRISPPNYPIFGYMVLNESPWTWLSAAFISRSWPALNFIKERPCNRVSVIDKGFVKVNVCKNHISRWNHPICVCLVLNGSSWCWLSATFISRSQP